MMKEVTIRHEDIFDKDGEYYYELKALAWLLANDYCFINTLEVTGYGGYKSKTVCVFVNCSDTFAFATADAEPITNDENEGSEIIELFKLIQEKSYHGATKWVCKRRNMQPQKPLKTKMIKDGAWDDELENLPENTYNKI